VIWKLLATITVREQLVLFRADDGLIASRNQEWLQMALARLCELFVRAGLRSNVQKTNTVTCAPGYVRGPVTSAKYQRRMEGVGETYRERQRRRAECSICGADLASSSRMACMEDPAAAPDAKVLHRRLIKAIQKGRPVGVIREIVGQNARLLLKKDGQGWVPLRYAARNASFEAVQ
jgi:hypothetical protein